MTVLLLYDTTISNQQTLLNTCSLNTKVETCLLCLKIEKWCTAWTCFRMHYVASGFLSLGSLGLLRLFGASWSWSLAAGLGVYLGTGGWRYLYVVVRTAKRDIKWVTDILDVTSTTNWLPDLSWWLGFIWSSSMIRNGSQTGRPISAKASLARRADQLKPAKTTQLAYAGFS